VSVGFGHSSALHREGGFDIRFAFNDLSCDT
jgi:hypothetical protein